MGFQLDHVFVCTSLGAPGANRLVEFGLTEGSPNVHVGQGTANRRFFFRNALLELLWVHEPREAQSAAISAARLWERWAGRRDGSCPFGLCLRPAEPGERDAPFPSWLYRAPFLPSQLAIHVATNAHDLSEPMLFHLPSGRRPDALGSVFREPLRHAAGFHEITRVRWIKPGVVAPLSAQLKSVVRAGLIDVESGLDHVLELGFDGESVGRRIDFLPELPLAFCW